MFENLNRHQRARALFERISALPASARAAALAEACVDDDSVQDDVARLLAADAEAGSFLEHGVALNATDSARLIGQRVGPYEIQVLIGVGGMGEVYRARDTTLRRDVALKILPDAFIDDADRVARFRREARVLAALNHPNIAAIHGVEESGGVYALVLELVNGPTLADRIAHGTIPLDETLAIARQVVDALDAAHALGIIHRDLKPANIKVRDDGTVKVLDFGLAKIVEGTGAGTSAAEQGPSQSPTITTPAMTAAGTILGTAAYMSPEQAKGKPADKRSDIWAFGCVLYEMLTGRRAFAGEDVAETLAEVIKGTPDWSKLPAGLPKSIKMLLRRCLEKDRKRRLADIADARLELDDVHDTALDDAAPTMQSNARTQIRGWLPASIAGAAAGVVLSLASVAVLNRPAPDLDVYRSSILFPGRLGPPRDSRGANIALSPDGRRLAFVATDSTGRTQLWLRALDSSTAQPLADTEGARTPFWSPDSRWVGFVANGALKKVDASGGPMVTLSGSALSGGAWSHDGVILFTTTTNNTLARVDAMGGTAATGVTTIDANTEWAHVSPSFLPDGRHFIYAATVGSGLWSSLGVYVASIDSGERTRLPIEAAYVQYARGFLWYARGSTLVAQPFDVDARRITGNAVPVAEQLHAPRTITMSAFSVSPAGALVYQSNPSPGYELTWFDRAGRRTGTVGTRDDYADLRLSPDGRRALVSVGEPDTNNRDLWMFDLARGVRTRFTSGPEPEAHSSWSPDGTRVVFDSQSGGSWGLFQKPSNGVGDIETILADGFDNNPIAWSPDGRFLLFTKREAETFNVWVLPLEGDRKPFPFTRSAVSLPSGFSPDGRWVVYMSRDSGRGEIYVAPFPGPGPRVLVSTAGGWDPRWRRDGKEIMYLDLTTTTSTLMSAAVTTDDGRLDVHEVKPLFPLAKVGPRSTYDITADGQRILAVTQDDEAARTPLTLVLNWPALLKQ